MICDISSNETIMFAMQVSAIEQDVIEVDPLTKDILKMLVRL